MPSDVVSVYLASSARVEANLTVCTLTVVTGARESSEIACSPSMLEDAQFELEQSIPQCNPKTDPSPKY